MHTCFPLFRILETAGQISLKIGVLRESLAIYFTQDGGYFLEVRITVHAFQHIYPLPHSFITQKGTLLVFYWPNSGLMLSRILIPSIAVAGSKYDFELAKSYCRRTIESPRFAFFGHI